MELYTLMQDIASSLVSGLLLAAIFFLLKEKIFPMPDIDGTWTFIHETTHTSYHAYEGMKLTYIAQLWREGSKIAGTAEKYHEDSSKQKTLATGTNKSSCELEGYIQKNIFSKDNIVIHISELGARTSSTICKLQIERKTFEMLGRFSSTVANQEGTSRWVKRN